MAKDLQALMLMCVVCGQSPLVLLGELGSLAWLRCQSCGFDQSIAASELFPILED